MVSFPALPDITNPVPLLPVLKIRFPKELFAINAVPPAEAVTKAGTAVVDVRYPASLFNWEILDPDTINFFQVAMWY